MNDTVITEGTFYLPVNYQVKQPFLICVLAFKVRTYWIFLFNSLPKSLFEAIIAVVARYKKASACPHLSKRVSEWDHTGIDWISQVRLLKHCAIVNKLNLTSPTWVSAKSLSLVEGRERQVWQGAKGFYLQRGFFSLKNKGSEGVSCR